MIAAYRTAVRDDFEYVKIGGYEGLVRKTEIDRISGIPEEVFPGSDGTPHEDLWIKPLKRTEKGKPPSRFTNNVALYRIFAEKGNLYVPKPLALLYPDNEGELKLRRPVYISEQVEGISPTSLSKEEAEKTAKITNNIFGRDGVKDHVFLDVAARDILIVGMNRPVLVDNENVLYGTTQPGVYAACVTDETFLADFGLHLIDSRVPTYGFGDRDHLQRQAFLREMIEPSWFNSYLAQFLLEPEE